MKLLIKILKKTGLYIAYLLLTILITLICAMLFSRKDYGNPETLPGDQIDKLALSHVNILSMEEGRQHIDHNMNILIDDGQISMITPDSIPIPTSYKIIDGSGKYLLPGLIDMHTHIFDRSDLAMYLGYGVTTVRNMMGFPMHLRWREQQANNEYPGSRMFTSSPTINSGDNRGPFHKNIENKEEAMTAVKEYSDRGYDFIKIYDGLNNEQFLGIMEEAKSNDIYVAGHPPHDIDLDVLLQSEIRSIEHVEEIVQGMMAYKLDTVLGREIAKKLKANNASVTITLSPFHNIYKATTEGETFLSGINKEQINPFIRFIGVKQMSQWVDTNEGTYQWHVDKYKCMEDLVRILNEEGVDLLLGTDTGPSLTIPGITLHQEISLLQQNGITPIDILRSGTINASRALGMENKFGSITAGKKAELLLLNDNPLANLETLKRPDAIISNGIWYDKANVEALRTLGMDKSNIFMTLGRFLNHLISK